MSQLAHIIVGESIHRCCRTFQDCGLFNGFRMKEQRRVIADTVASYRLPHSLTAMLFDTAAVCRPMFDGIRAYAHSVVHECRARTVIDFALLERNIRAYSRRSTQGIGSF